MNPSAPLRTALVGAAPITALLGIFSGAPSVHTRRPVPSTAGYPMIITAGDVAVSDEDALADSIPVITRDISIYGEAVAHFRDVESLGYLVRDLFHRQHFAISVPGHEVIDITATGPFVAPTSDDQYVGRMVTLRIRLQATG